MSLWSVMLFMLHLFCNLKLVRQRLPQHKTGWLFTLATIVFSPNDIQIFRHSVISDGFQDPKPWRLGPSVSQHLSFMTRLCCNDKNINNILLPLYEKPEKFRLFQLKAAAQKRRSTWKKDAGSGAFSQGGHMQQHMLCPHWEPLKKGAGAQKKTLCGHVP